MLARTPLEDLPDVVVEGDLSQLVGRFNNFDNPVRDGERIGWYNDSRAENKLTFGVPGADVQYFLDALNAGQGGNCSAALRTIGFGESDIEYKASAYRDGSLFYYMVLGVDTVDALPATWEGALNATVREYSQAPNAPSDLRDVLYGHLPTFRAWSASMMRNGSRAVFEDLVADDVDGLAYDVLTSYTDPRALDTDQFFGLWPSPSAVATRAWLANRAGLFQVFAGDGKTALPNLEPRPEECDEPDTWTPDCPDVWVDGIDEVIMTNRELDSQTLGDQIVSVPCQGDGFAGSPGFYSLFVNVWDGFEVYVDGELLGQGGGIGQEDEYGQAFLFDVPSSYNTLAIRGFNRGSDNSGGIMATLGATRGYSDAEWVCRVGFQEEWVQPEYSLEAANGWLPALTVAEGSAIPNHHEDAIWIWTADNLNDNDIVCVMPRREDLSDSVGLSGGEQAAVVIAAVTVCALAAVGFVVWRRRKAASTADLSTLADSNQLV